MDNITHSLTGALAAKLIEKKGTPRAEEKSYGRTLLWLLVLCTNLPDIDGLLGVFGGRILSLQHHRGITHSLLFAPAFALLPAGVFYLLRKRQDFRTLWIIGQVGIIIHIFFDLVTPFGTRIFLPLSSERFSLDWMFIIDPVFTIVLAFGLLTGKLIRKRRKLVVLIAGIVVVLYLATEAIMHSVALNRVEDVVNNRGWKATKISALPQPLIMLRWMGLVQTENGVIQTFFSVFDPSDTLRVKIYSNDGDKFVDKAMDLGITKWYLTFARHPWVQSFHEGGKQLVEFRDLQFSIDERILKTVGFTERSTPFVLRFVFDSEGNLLQTTFDRRTLESNP